MPMFQVTHVFEAESEKPAAELRDAAGKCSGFQSRAHDRERSRPCPIHAPLA